MPFYINPMVNSIGIRNTFVVMAMISLVLAFACVFSLVFYGESLRKWSGQPNWNRSMVRPPTTIDPATGQPVEMREQGLSESGLNSRMKSCREPC